jgi:CheY-like chemotaxis protein
MLVEDDDADAYLVVSALSSNPRVGRIVRARDGVEALAIVDERKFRPDLAIIDLALPRKDGFAVLLELRHRVTVEFPSFVLTSSRYEPDIYRSEKRGAKAFITKPDSLEKLTTLMDKVVATIERPH